MDTTASDFLAREGLTIVSGGVSHSANEAACRITPLPCFWSAILISWRICRRRHLRSAARSQRRFETLSHGAGGRGLGSYEQSSISNAAFPPGGHWRHWAAVDRPGPRAGTPLHRLRAVASETHAARGPGGAARRSPQRPGIERRASWPRCRALGAGSARPWTHHDPPRRRAQYHRGHAIRRRGAAADRLRGHAFRRCRPGGHNPAPYAAAQRGRRFRRHGSRGEGQRTGLDDRKWKATTRQRTSALPICGPPARTPAASMPFATWLPELIESSARSSTLPRTSRPWTWRARS